MRRRLTYLLWLLLWGLLSVPSVLSQGSEPPIVVGRIYHIEGELLRYIPAEKDWVAVVKDAPFGSEDTLYTGNSGMSELIAPNGTWIRIGYNTQIEFIALEADLSEVDVASGVARFYNKGSNLVVKATCPFGYVLAYPGTVFDMYVGDNSVEVVAIQGKAAFVHSATEARYDIAAGSPSILCDNRQVSSGEGDVDPDWDRWNLAREDLWQKRGSVRERAAEYLPPALQTESYALEENGRWERVYYEGAERSFWRPVNVAAGWAPFTVGRWTEWYGDQTWIPAEPFGYVTHHYGNWVYAGNVWYWAPPVVAVQAGVPLLDVGYHWYPGRVSWIHTDTYVGWVPLAPHETFYSHHHWGGPRSVVVTSATFGNINLQVRNYAYINHAVIVNQTNFYSVNSYTTVRVTNINHTTIINNYRAAPVVNNTVINNYTVVKNRYNYSNAVVNEKPHMSVVNRIEQNHAIIREGRHERAAVIEERVSRMHEGRVGREVRIERPKVTNALVPASEMHRPRSEVKLPQREIGSRGERIRPGGSGAESGRPREPAGGERGQPPRGERQEPGGAAGVRSPRGDRPETPGKGDRPETPGPKVRPGAGERPETPGQVGKPERGRGPTGSPETSGQPGGAERVRSPRGDRQEKPGPSATQPSQQGGATEHVKPQRAQEQQGGPQGGPAAQPAQGGGSPERAKPQRAQEQKAAPQQGGQGHDQPAREKPGKREDKPGPADQQGQPGSQEKPR